MYLSLFHIDTSWYTLLTTLITSDEVLQTISKLPNNKACGPTGISYEMIKHLYHHCIITLIAFFNRYLLQNIMPQL